MAGLRRRARLAPGLLLALVACARTSPTPAPAGRQVVAQFVGRFDPTSRQLTLEMQPAGPSAMVQIPEGSDPGQVSVYNAVDPWEDTACGGADSLTGTVAIASHYQGQLLSNVYAVLDSLSGVGVHACNSDPDHGPLTSADGGLWSYGDLWSGQVRTHDWSFALGVGAFTFTGHVEADAVLTEPPFPDLMPGYYAHDLTLHLSASYPGATVHCTTDGTDPTPASPVCAGAIAAPLAGGGSLDLRALTVPPSGPASAIAYLQYYGTEGNVGLSRDGGLTWTWTALPAGSQTDAIAWDGVHFLTAGAGGVQWTTPDALEPAEGWSSASLTDDSVSGARVYVAGATYVATAYGSGKAVLFTSTDLQTWTPRALPLDLEVVGPVVAGSGKLVAFAKSTGGAAVILASSDAGATWGTATVPAGTSVNCSHDYFPRCGALTWTGSHFVGFQPAGQLLTSPDGLAWTRTTGMPGAGVTMRDVVWTGSQLVAVGTSGIYTAPDFANPALSTWTHRAPATYEFFAVAAHGADLVAVGRTGVEPESYVTTSTDGGVSWTPGDFPWVIHTEGDSKSIMLKTVVTDGAGIWLATGEPGM